ncbi:CHRD domain containing protein [Pyrenophora teres f. maculata]|nr:CHRD domain containing protein [Pyrenophora teres f. maculata]
MHFTTTVIAGLVAAPLALAAPSILSGSILSGGVRSAYFDAEYTINATPDQVIATTGESVPGQPGASGVFRYGINVAENVICYNIKLSGVTGEYKSMAATATHIHEAVAGKAGPPRIAFPNPTGSDSCRTSVGCLKGPFITGITNTTTGKDQGDGFNVAQILANPTRFFTDTHTASYSAGAVRGQFCA